MRKNLRTSCGVVAALATLLALARADSAKPETVLITFHPKHGSEQVLADVIARHWAVARELRLVHDTPHVTLRGIDPGGNPYFVEVLTWRDAAIPNSAPKAIVDLWDQINALVEPRDARPGLDFREVTVLSAGR